MSGLNPFSGLGKIERYIRWNRFRGTSWQQTQHKTTAKFGRRFGKIIKSTIADTRLIEGSANRFKASGLERDISEIDLPLGQNKAKNLRISGRTYINPVNVKGFRKSGERLFTFDIPRKGTKRQIQRSIREQIIASFMDHYNIAQKYKPYFNRKFKDIEITDIEGV